MQRTMIRVAGMVALSAAGVLAQGGGQPPRPATAAPQPSNQIRVLRGQAGEPGGPGARGVQMRERMTQMLKERVGLTDQQITKLQETRKKYAEKHRVLADQARDIRMGLRDEMMRPDSARASQLTALLDRETALGRTRLELREAEQKELATFLSPIQRVKLGAAAGMMRQRMMGGRGMGPGGGRGGMGRGQGRQGGQMGPGGQGMGQMRGQGGQGMGRMPGMGGMGQGRQGGMMGPGGMGGQMGPGGMGGQMGDMPMGPPGGQPQRMGPPNGQMRRMPPPAADSTKKKPEN